MNIFKRFLHKCCVALLYHALIKKYHIHPDPVPVSQNNAHYPGVVGVYYFHEHAHIHGATVLDAVTPYSLQGLMNDGHCQKAEWFVHF